MASTESLGQVRMYSGETRVAKHLPHSKTTFWRFLARVSNRALVR